jgi:hypothetical protein
VFGALDPDVLTRDSRNCDERRAGRAASKKPSGRLSAEAEDRAGADLVMEMKVVETMSTCTLRPLPANVREVTNWLELLEALCAKLGAVLEAATSTQEARQVGLE